MRMFRRSQSYGARHKALHAAYPACDGVHRGDIVLNREYKAINCFNLGKRSAEPHGVKHDRSD